MTDPGSDTDAASRGPKQRCRFCGSELRHTFVDLGMSPPCESFLTEAEIDLPETFFPLHVFVCERCLLVQLPTHVSPEEVFTEYAYFSSYSTAWLDHAAAYSKMIIERFGLGPASFVVELASNDGYLLRNFVEAGIPALGIEPAANVADAAGEAGVTTLVEFFDSGLARRLVDDGKAADLIIGNNVLAQVPELNSFVEGMSTLLAPGGTVTLEFPHLVRLMEGNQFDTIYHEHYSYFSLLTVEQVLTAHGLTVFDVDELWTHGGSLRIYARHAGEEDRPVSEGVIGVRSRELELGLERVQAYGGFAAEVERTKRELLAFLCEAKAAGNRIAGYGAPGKGNTLLNYCGIRTDFLDYTVDRNPYKHGRFTPGTHIPIDIPGRLDETKPDFVLILPWNLKDEIVAQLAHIREWGGRFVVPIPDLQVLS